MIAPREIDLEARALATLARIVVEDAEAACRRTEDRALNESRSVVLAAEDRIADLAGAARDLGRARGRAADAAEAEAARREVAAVGDGAFDALYERFERRVLMALKALPEDEGRYAPALAAWAAAATRTMDGPAEVFTARRDRAAVYAALLAAGAADFHVRVDHRVHVGFVVRDLDGRTCFDARPAALVTAQAPALRALLERAVPEAPRLPDALPPEPVAADGIAPEAEGTPVS